MLKRQADKVLIAECGRRVQEHHVRRLLQIFRGDIGCLADTILMASLVSLRICSLSSRSG